MKAPHLNAMVTGLRCLKCDARFAPDPAAYTCPTCVARDSRVPGVLDVEYDYAQVAPIVAQWFSGEEPVAGMHRYVPLLPTSPGRTGPTAGGTPLVESGLTHNSATILHKLESTNPSRCLKDRATAIACALAARLTKSHLYCASAGNAAASLAAFCAAETRTAHVYVPHDVSQARLDLFARFRADVHVSTGDYDQAYDEAEDDASRHGWYSRNCAYNPFLVEGKKTVAFEIAHQLSGRVPDVVVAPVGDGCTLAAIGKGFRELVAVGLVDRIPRLVGVQTERVQPLVQRFHGMPETIGGETRASSIKVQRPRNGVRLLSELRASGGTMIAVSDADIAAAQNELRHVDHVAAEFTSAAGLAALRRHARHPAIVGTVVLVITAGEWGDSPR